MNCSNRSAGPSRARIRNVAKQVHFNAPHAEIAFQVISLGSNATGTFTFFGRNLAGSTVTVTPLGAAPSPGPSVTLTVAPSGGGEILTVFVDSTGIPPGSNYLLTIRTPIGDTFSLQLSIT